MSVPDPEVSRGTPTALKKNITRMAIAFLVFLLSAYFTFDFNMSLLRLLPKEVGAVLIIKRPAIINSKVAGSTFTKELFASRHGEKKKESYENTLKIIRELAGVEPELAASIFEEIIVGYIDPVTLPGDIPKNYRPVSKKFGVIDFGPRHLVLKLLKRKIPFDERKTIEGFKAGRIKHIWVAFVKNFIVIGEIREVKLILEAAAGPEANTLASMDEWQWAMDERSHKADITAQAVPSRLINTIKYMSEDYPALARSDKFLALQAQEAVVLNAYINKQGLTIDGIASGNEEVQLQRVMSKIDAGENFRDMMADSYKWAMFPGIKNGLDDWEQIREIYSRRPELIAILDGIKSNLKNETDVDLEDLLALITGECGFIFTDSGLDRSVIFAARVSGDARDKLLEMEQGIWGKFKTMRVADREIRYLKRLVAYTIKDDILFMANDEDVLSMYMESLVQKPVGTRLKAPENHTHSPWSALFSFNISRIFEARLMGPVNLTDGVLTVWKDGNGVRADFYTPSKIGDGSSLNRYSSSIDAFYTLAKLVTTTALAVSLLFILVYASRLRKSSNS